jgi:hypothetical protein
MILNIILLQPEDYTTTESIKNSAKLKKHTNIVRYKITGLSGSLTSTSTITYHRKTPAYASRSFTLINGVKWNDARASNTTPFFYTAG